MPVEKVAQGWLICPVFVYCINSSEISQMFDTLFEELNDMPGEIFDVIEFKEEWEKEDKFDVEKHINGDIEF